MLSQKPIATLLYCFKVFDVVLTIQNIKVAQKNFQQRKEGLYRPLVNVLMFTVKIKKKNKKVEARRLELLKHKQKELLGKREKELKE